MVTNLFGSGAYRGVLSWIVGAVCISGFMVDVESTNAIQESTDSRPISRNRDANLPTDRWNLAIDADARAAVNRGLNFLISRQRSDGAWEAFEKPHPAVTALVCKAIAQSEKHGPSDKSVVRGVEFLLTFSRPDGGIYVEGEGQPNYHTSVALLALSSLRNPAHADHIRGAQDYLKKLQWDEGEGHETTSPWYGGQGYGRHKRPDLSNTQMMLEALRDSGLPSDDPVYQKALVFISRSQVLDDSNDQAFADGRSDGGFVYTPANGGESMAGTEVVDGRPVLRSYGSMTYAGFKSLLYADVDRNDSRIKAALAWIQRNYTLDHNPSMPGAQSMEGLYYYYHVFARALNAWGAEFLADDRGIPHDWRAELCRKLISLQRSDGSWVNEKDRWFEGNPHLVTAYAVLAMQTALEFKAERAKQEAP